MVSDAEIDEALQAERLLQHQRVLLGSLLGSASVGLLLSTSLWRVAEPAAVLGWLALLAAALGVRWAGVRTHGQPGLAQEERARALTRHRYTYLLHGLAWVSVVLVPRELLPGRDLDLMVFALSIVTAGALTTAAFDLRTALCFAVPTLSMGLLLALRSQEAGTLSLAGMAGIYLLVTAITARRSQMLLREGVRLRLSDTRRADEARLNRERADQATERLADQHRLLTQLMQTTRQGFWFIDNEARTTDLNPAMSQMLGEPLEALRGRNVFDFIAAGDQERLRTELARRQRGEAGHYEVGLRRRDGSQIHCLCTATAVYDAQGVKVGSVGVWNDISQRRATEAALRHYEMAVNAITDVVSVVDREERYLLVNDAWCRAARVPREQALGRLTSEVLSQRVSEARLRALRECMATGESRTARGPDPRASRPGCVIETTYFPQKDGAGQVQQVVMVTRDVTEEERSRLALVASDAEHRALLDNFPGFISRLDARQVYTFVNAHLARQFGSTPQAIMGRSIAEVLGPERAETLAPLFQRALAGETVRYEHRLQPVDGGPPMDLQIHMVAAVDPLNGEPVVYGFTLDITPLKRAEAALRESSAELGALLDAFPGYIASTDENLRYTYINDRLLAVFGRTREQTLGHTVREVLGEERAPPVEAAIRRAFRGETAVTEADLISAHDGQRLVLEVTRVTSVPRPGGRHTCYGFGVDITARKLAEVALIAARDEAEAANRAKSQFLSQMSHELRTPLNAVLGFGQLLATDPRASLATHQQGWVQEILGGAEHLLSLINELLDLGRIEAGELALDIQPLGPGELVAECLALVHTLAQSLQVQLLEAAPVLLAVQVQADRRRLKQVLLNLLGNAIKYNRPGGTVGVRSRVEEGWLWLGVEDTGPGLTPEQQARLFQPFERLGAAQSGVEGTGIGLALSRRLVDAMGGRIGVSSVPGEGSTFWLRLPLAGAPAALPVLPDAGAGQGGAEAATAQPPQTVLYIEDNPVNVVLMEAMMARVPGVQLHCAATPTEGLAMAARHPPALVLLDIHLPEMDGFAVLRRLREMPATAHTPVVAVSANALQDDINAAGDAGFAAYLTKPLALQSLLDAVKLHLGRP